MKERIKKVSENIYEIPKEGKMLVPGRIFASEETVYEVWRPANKNGWDTVYNRLSPEKSEMTEEKVQRLFFEMLKLTVPTEDSSKKEENKDKEITVMTLRHSA